MDPRAVARIPGGSPSPGGTRDDRGMTGSTTARLWWGGTAVAVVVALAIQIPIIAAAAEDAFFSTPTYRVLNLFAFFTIWSNILVAVVAARLAAGGDLGHVAWRVARLAGLVAITVTFAVYNLVLRGINELSVWGAVADELFHTAVPLLTVLGWLLFGPRSATSWQVVAWSLVMPAAWALFTLLRGEVVGGWYPYPFLDVTELGYPTAVRNIAIVGVVFLALAALAHVVDRALVRRSAGPQTTAADSRDPAAT
jgi:hypothetical protein